MRPACLRAAHRYLFKDNRRIAFEPKPFETLDSEIMTWAKNACGVQGLKFSLTPSEVPIGQNDQGSDAWRRAGASSRTAPFRLGGTSPCDETPGGRLDGILGKESNLIGRAGIGRFGA